MSHFMKGVFKTPPPQMETPSHPSFQAQGFPFPQYTPLITPKLQYTPNACEDANVAQAFPLMPTRDVTRAQSLSIECQKGKLSSQEISTTSNKTIKITLEDVAASTTAAKKPELHPQEKLDQFWNVFEPEYLGKINRILPSSLIESSPAASKQAGDRSHKAFRSHEEAKARCIRDVKRIIRECRTHNKRYTDTHFDIERDLKITRRRDCLDGLYNYSTAGGGNPDKTAPTDVKRVCDVFENPTFFSRNASSDDIIQGNLGDCWLLAAFSILTCNEKLVKNICVIQDAEVGVYGFVFYRDGDWHQTIIDDKLYLRAPSYDESGDVVLGMYGVQQRDQERSYNDLFQTGSKSLYFASCREENETWVPLLEKALAKAHGSYAALSGGQTGEAIEDLTGGVTTEIYTTNILNKDKFWHDELRKIGSQFVFSAAVASYREWRAPGNSSIRNERRQGIVSQHAYAILDTYEGHGQRLVKMRNPWGSTEWNGAWSDGSKEWTHEWIERLNHRFGDDGIFWISYEDMLRKYKYLDRTRIFGPEWHVAQQWTSVQVPWNTTNYQQTKFQIDVPEPTDAVIVISQLDDRYYQGLQGKYNYTLQFRIQKDDDEEEEYLSRSANNYELVRSNNVEVPLEKGRYTVLFKVEARKTNRKDVEAVIRENIWRKEKLMQVGTLYDLAHQKGQQNMPRGSGKAVETAIPTLEEKKDGKEVVKEEKDKDPNRDPWNAFCVVGLRIYSKQPSMVLNVMHPHQDEEPATPVLDRDDIAKAPLQEAVQNSEQTPEGSVTDGEHTVVQQIRAPQKR
ncbi:hypothetical protein LTR64_005511 [Lithohypha guttulata]|uniref:uncharacterized protein n=1 Tax=Lithohypha guttulata TaxID=1690604 RepID=UPI002DDDE08B|nr:hypothetical protein LTR51_002696 [Lithohypha guttulata]